MVTLVTRHRPRNFAEFWWYSDFTAMLMLVQNTPLAFCIQKSKLIMHTFQTPTELWDACPIKINLLARTLFERLMTVQPSAAGEATGGVAGGVCDDTDDIYNLVFVVQQICNLNRLAYYVAVSLLWAALYRFAGQPIQMFRMHRLADLLPLLHTVDLDRPLELRLSRVHRLLTLVSAMQSLVVLRKPRHEEYVCFRSCFRVTVGDLSTITAWLKLLKEKMVFVGDKKRENEDCLQIIEMLDLDILHFMDNKLQETKNNGDAYE